MNVDVVLTPCEQEITERIALGQSKKEVAYLTFRSIGTVETTLKNVYTKLGINKASELTLWYVGNVFGISRQIAEQRSKILTICIAAIMSLSISFDISSDAMRMRRRARRRQSTEIITITSNSTI